MYGNDTLKKDWKRFSIGKSPNENMFIVWTEKQKHI